MVAVTASGTVDLVEVCEGAVDRVVVELDDLVALLAVGLFDGVLDLGDRLVAGQDARDGEEAGLHDGVGAAAHAGLASHLGGVDAIDLEFEVDDRLLDLAREVLPDLVGRVGRVDAGRWRPAGHRRACRASR